MTGVSRVPVLMPVKTHHLEGAVARKISQDSNSSCWGGVEVRRGVICSGVIFVSEPWFKITRSVANNPRVALQWDTGKYLLTH
ncbi:hypothetical protein TNCV_2823151 [Trichonephila clavipes]|nr:hypothetical protein TNCV_2823151 [Trichonephila clavipes]